MHSCTLPAAPALCLLGPFPDVLPQAWQLPQCKLTNRTSLAKHHAQLRFPLLLPPASRVEITTSCPGIQISATHHQALGSDGCVYLLPWTRVSVHSSLHPGSFAASGQCAPSRAAVPALSTGAELLRAGETVEKVRPRATSWGRTSLRGRAAGATRTPHPRVPALPPEVRSYSHCRPARLPRAGAPVPRSALPSLSWARPNAPGAAADS